MFDHSAANHVFVRSRPDHGNLTPSTFGQLVGAFDRATLVPEGSARPDDNHLYLWVHVEVGPFAGRYECAVNVRSVDGSQVQYADPQEDLTGKSFPELGFEPAALAYGRLQVGNEDFRAVRDGDLQTLLTHYAQQCDRMAVLGLTYPDGTGMHDIHMNSGEAPGSFHENRTNQDGAIIFYFQNSAPESPRSYARWVLIKFATQTLAA